MDIVQKGFDSNGINKTGEHNKTRKCHSNTPSDIYLYVEVIHMNAQDEIITANICIYMWLAPDAVFL